MRISDWSSDVCSSDLNEYLGLLIETGIPGILVLALFAAALVVRGIGLVRDPASGGTYAIPAGLSIGLIALHSIVDYPLRTPTEIVLFAILLVLFYSGGSDEHTSEPQQLIRLSYAVSCLKK